MRKFFLVLTAFAAVVGAREYQVTEFSTLPKSYVKDFYIWQKLQKGVTKSEAEILYKQIKRLSPKLFNAFAKYDIDNLSRKKYCKGLSAERLIGKNGDCVQHGLSLYKASISDPKLVSKIASDIELFYPNLSKKYQAVIKKSFDEFIKLPPKLLIETFLAVGKAYRKAYLNHPLPPSLITKLSSYTAFNVMVDRIVRDQALDKLQKSLVEIDSSKLNANANFLLGMNAIRYGELERALGYLELSSHKAKTAFDRDRAIFWRYMLTKSKTYLTTLTNSYDLNIYTLRAYELLGKFPTNIIYDINPKSTTIPFDIKDPFAWLKFKNMVQKEFKNHKDKVAYLLKYNTPQTLPHIAKLLYRFKDNKHYFITPYSKYLKNTPLERRVLIYAIARQESRFIPTDVSSSYALGMMQFMPFLAKDIAKKFGMIDFKLIDIFDPKIALKFANYHLDYLEKHLSNPLFIAYAYNGGLGFTKREILAKDFFKSGAYEPFWSMEMVPNAQARRYGKKVLANYVIYARHLGLGVSLTDILQTLKSPHRSY